MMEKMFRLIFERLELLELMKHLVELDPEANRMYHFDQMLMTQSFDR